MISCLLPRFPHWTLELSLLPSPQATWSELKNQTHLFLLAICYPAPSLSQQYTLWSHRICVRLPRNWKILESNLVSYAARSTMDRGDTRPQHSITGAKSHDSDLAKVITIIVGMKEAQQTFVLHETLLRQSSAFFNNALKDEWKEAQERSVKLPDIEPSEFTVFAKFILTGMLFVRSDEDIAIIREKKWDSAAEKGRYATFTAIFDLVKLANFLQAPDFQDVIIDVFIESILDYRLLMGHPFTFASPRMNLVYEHSSSGSLIRTFFLDVCLHAWMKSGGHRNMDFTQYPSQFSHDLIQASLSLLKSKDDPSHIPHPADLSKSCKYQEHTKRKEPCYKDRFRFLPKFSSSRNGTSTTAFCHCFMLRIDSSRCPSRCHVRTMTSASIYPNTTHDISTTQHSERQSRMKSKNRTKKDMKNIRRGNQEMG